jgi:transcriptional regulator with XRE-family HTH domain
MAFVIQAKTDLLFKVEQTVLTIIQEEGNVTFYVVVCKQGDRSKTTILRLNEEPKSVLCLNEEQKLIFQKLSVLVQQSQSIFIVQVQNITSQSLGVTRDFEETRNNESRWNDCELTNTSTIYTTTITKSKNILSHMKSSNNLKFGVILRLFRNKKQITLLQLSQMTGLSLSYLSTIENNLRKPNIDVLSTICQALGVPLEVVLILASDSDDPFVKNHLLPLIQSISKELYGCTEDEIIQADSKLSPNGTAATAITAITTGDISEEMTTNFC